jgi:hypothetical protein
MRHREYSYFTKVQLRKVFEKFCKTWLLVASSVWRSRGGGLAEPRRLTLAIRDGGGLAEPPAAEANPGYSSPRRSGQTLAKSRNRVWRNRVWRKKKRKRSERAYVWAWRNREIASGESRVSSPAAQASREEAQKPSEWRYNFIFL